MKLKFLAACLACAMATQTAMAVTESDAKNFLTVATGRVASLNDPEVARVLRQLETIEDACARTSRGPGIHDKLGYSMSQVNSSGTSLLQMLADFIPVAKAQCGTIQDATLLAVYVLERNSGASHTATIKKLTTAPRPLIQKWSNKRSGS